MNKKVVIGLVIALVLVLIALIGAVVYALFIRTAPYGVPEERDDRFGFLISDIDQEGYEIATTGAGWIRPHPGHFIWGKMQLDAESENDYSLTDEQVLSAQDNGFNSLITIWPFAGWDQQDRDNAEQCLVEDVFSEEIGSYRCIPNDLTAYQDWLRTVVERYDGDGENDMEGLSMPIKHWEIGNEPDLTGDTLQFMVASPDEYVLLLQMSQQAIKQADPDAKVVIAAPSGVNQEAKDYFDQIFEYESIGEYFDIATIHAISSGDIENLNIVDYKNMLIDNDLNKPIWVTEAETFISQDTSANATQLFASSRRAFLHGAEKIFFTSLKFDSPPGENQVATDFPQTTETFENLDLSTSVGTYRQIFYSLPQPNTDLQDQKTLHESL